MGGGREEKIRKKRDGYVDKQVGRQAGTLRTQAGS